MHVPALEPHHILRPHPPLLLSVFLAAGWWRRRSSGRRRARACPSLCSCSASLRREPRGEPARCVGRLLSRACPLSRCVTPTLPYSSPLALQSCWRRRPGGRAAARQAQAALRLLHRLPPAGRGGARADELRGGPQGGALQRRQQAGQPAVRRPAPACHGHSDSSCLQTGRAERPSQPDTTHTQTHSSRQTPDQLDHPAFSPTPAAAAGPFRCRPRCKPDPFLASRGSAALLAAEPAGALRRRGAAWSAGRCAAARGRRSLAWRGRCR